MSYIKQVWYLMLCIQVLLERAQSDVDAEGCKDLTFKDTFKGKALKSHVIKTERATDDGHCQTMCFIDDRCIAYNFGKDKDNQNNMCELSESDHVMHPEDLVDRPDTVYRRAENNCRCPKYQVCRVNFVDNTHRCECKAGFTGQQCDIEMTPCGSSPCMNGATCTNNADQFSCTCKAGFTGKFCETAINHCDSSPCLNGATCNGNVAGYSCQCLDGFMGQHCQIKYYKGTKGVVPWSAADKECQRLGTNLPSIHSDEQNEIVRQLHVKVTKWMWIGLHQNERGMFVWSDGTPVDYENWGLVQAHPSAGCVYIQRTGKWYKYPCTWGNGNGCILQ